MKVTAVSVQLRDPNRVNVMIDGKYRFSLDVFQITALGLKVGQEYDDKGLGVLEAESQFGKLYARGLEYCLVRPRSSREIRDYLHRKTFSKKYMSKRTGEMLERPGVSKEVAIRVYERLQEKGYVNDERFARYWVENRNLRKGASQRKLRTELQAKGVESSVIDAMLQASERSDESELKKIIAKKHHRYTDDSKFMQYLARQGFSYDDIKAALADDGE